MPESKAPSTKDALAADAVLKAYNDANPAPRIIDNADFTDVGNAKRLVATFGDRIRYCHPWKSWLCWNGKFWERDNTGQIFRYAKDTAKAMLTEAEDMTGEMREKMRKHAVASKSLTKLKAMVTLAESEEGITVIPEQLDNSPFLLACQNGTLNLLTQEFREHRREDFMTKLSPVIYDPLASCPLWLAFLERIMQKNPEMIAYLQNLAGQCLTGEVREKSFYIFWGAGGDNGKTSFVEAIQYILDEYAQTIPIAALIKENKSSIPVDLHSLKGARFAFASEPDLGDTLTDGLIKRITGRDTMKTRTLHEKPVQWKPQFKLVIATNNRPKIPDASGAMWGRVKCIPFIEKILPEEQDKQLPDKLRKEAPGILNWMIAGCRKWLSDGMKEPLLITQTVQNYREDSDKLAEWFDYCFDKKYDGFVPFKIYYPLYKLWCANHEVRPVQENTLPTLMENRGYQNNRGWYNNSKGEKVRDRGCFGFQLKSWLSGRKIQGITESNNNAKSCDMPCHVDRLVDIPPVQLILEAADSDYEQAKWLFGEVDRQKQVDSIYAVSHELHISNMSTMSSTSHVSDIPIFPLDSDSVQSVQSVQNNINNKIIELLKESFDSYTLEELLKDYKDIDEIKAEMERILLRNLDEIPDNKNLMKYIDDYWQERDRCTDLPQIEKIKILKHIIWQAEKEQKTATSQDYIITKANEVGIPAEIATDMLGKLKFAGELIEVSEGRYRVI